MPRPIHSFFIKCPLFRPPLDHRLVPALNVIAERYKISDDIAGTKLLKSMVIGHFAVSHTDRWLPKPCRFDLFPFYMTSPMKFQFRPMDRHSFFIDKCRCNSHGSRSFVTGTLLFLCVSLYHPFSYGNGHSTLQKVRQHKNDERKAQWFACL